MTEAEFLEHLTAWTDGTLDDATADAMAAYVNAHPQAADLADAHREFDQRVRAALLAGVDGERVVNALLESARPGTSAEKPELSARSVTSTQAPPRRPGRILLFARGIAAAAAAVLIAFSMGWFYCIGPFECPLIEALENATDAVPLTTADLIVPSSIGHPDQAVPSSDPDRVQVDYAVKSPALRARYVVGGKDLTVIWAETGANRPSMRRRVVIQGREWWIAEEDGRRIVLFEDEQTGLLCCLVCETTEKELLAIADGLRTRAP